jgi:hypothetical protein
MPQNKRVCECALCFYKKNQLDNLVFDNDNVIEAIIRHFIFRLGSLVKSPKKIETFVMLFINLVDPAYIILNNDSSEKLKQSINIIYKDIMAGGHILQYSTNTSITKVMNKEAEYLKALIKSLDDQEQMIREKENMRQEQQVDKQEVELVEKVEEVKQPIVDQVAHITTVVIIEDLERIEPNKIEPNEIEPNEIESNEIEPNEIETELFEPHDQVENPILEVTKEDIAGINKKGIEIHEEDDDEDVKKDSYLNYCIIC